MQIVLVDYRRDIEGIQSGNIINWHSSCTAHCGLCWLCVIQWCCSRFKYCPVRSTHKPQPLWHILLWRIRSALPKVYVRVCVSHCICVYVNAGWKSTLKGLTLFSWSIYGYSIWYDWSLSTLNKYPHTFWALAVLSGLKIAKCKFLFTQFHSELLFKGQVKKNQTGAGMCGIFKIAIFFWVRVQTQRYYLYLNKKQSQEWNVFVWKSGNRQQQIWQTVAPSSFTTSCFSYNLLCLCFYYWRLHYLWQKYLHQLQKRKRNKIVGTSQTKYHHICTEVT